MRTHARNAELVFWLKNFSSRRWITDRITDRITSIEVINFFRSNNPNASPYASARASILNPSRTSWIKDNDSQLAWIYERLFDYARSNGLIQTNRKLLTNIWLLDPECCSYSQKASLLLECFEPREQAEELFENLSRSWMATRSEIDKHMAYFKKASVDKHKILISVLEKTDLSSSEPSESAASCIQGRIGHQEASETDVQFILYTLWGNSPNLMQEVVRKTKDRYRKQLYNQKNHKRKQFNIMLNVGLVNTLDQIIEEAELSRSELLERLIQDFIAEPSHPVRQEMKEIFSKNETTKESALDTTSITGGPIGGSKP